MKIGLYQDPRGAIGGGDYCLVVLAHALLTEGHEVDIVHHQGEHFAERLSEFFSIDLSGVGERALPNPGQWCVPESPISRRGRALRDWLSDASTGYDVFVCMTHNPPPFNRARVGVLYVLFPFSGLSEPWGRRSVKEWMRSKFYAKWWRERMQTYSSVASISEFSRHWTSKYWGVNSSVVFPPVDVSRFEPGTKDDRILVLGRFSHSKNQVGLVRTFGRYRDRLPGWSMACVGGYATENPEARDYFDLVKQEAADGVAELIPNCPQEQVPVELARSRVFWHAMGIGVDEQREPLRIEHFGIATVEAMAAGCVPIVVDGGGQREIVTHGETGYLCNSLDEFAERTIELAVDRGRAEKLAAAARHRAKDFARPVFEARLLALIRPHLAAYPDARR